MTILESIIAALSDEERVMLATIVSAKGSTPAAAASKMLLRNQGATPVGTIGGGCMEGEAINRARMLFSEAKAQIVTYHLNEDDAAHGLICGGSLDILIEPLTRADLPLLHDLRALYENGEDCIVATTIDASGAICGRTITHPDSLTTPVRWTRPQDLLSGAAALPPEIGQLVASAFRRKETVCVPVPGATMILEPFAAAPKLVVYGGGHVGRAISRLASTVGFRVTVADDREKYASRERFPEAAETQVIDFHNAVAPLDIRVSTSVVIVTRGHAFDEEVLEQVLRTPARYVGMIGSKRKVLTAMRHLHARGVALDALRRVQAPIGIEIGAVTAEEIAVSIVAQLIHFRRGRTMVLQYKSDDMRMLLQELDPQPLIASL